MAPPQMTREDAETLARKPSYPAAVAMSAQLMGRDTLTCVERGEIGLALADEHLGQGSEFEASADAQHQALETLFAAERDLADRALWTSDEALPARETMVRLLDRQAALLLAMDQAAAGFHKARLAQSLAADFGEEASDAAEDRAELMMACAHASGREDFVTQAQSAMDALGLEPEMAGPAGGALASAPPPEVMAAPAPESMAAPTPAARRRRAARASPAPIALTGEAPYFEVPVYFATHRNRTGRKNPYDYFRGQRAPLSVGKAVVTVPKMREAGVFKPAKRRSAKSADKARLITLETIDLIEDMPALMEDMGRDVSASTRKEALVFIHGYNTSFAGALQRAGQLAVDLDIDGAALLYSWPSRGSLLSYVVDRNQIVFKFIDDLQRLLVDVAMETGAERVHILAHSMGCQFLLDALHAALTNPKVQAKPETPIADEVIFASPDVDVDNFTGKLTKARNLARRITVYGSTDDRALQASQFLQGGIRAGQAPELVGRAGFDAIDTTAAEQDFVGHTDYSKSAIDDVRTLVWVEADTPPGKRAALLTPHESGAFFLFRGNRAGSRGGLFRRALLYLREHGAGPAKTVLGAVVPASPQAAGPDERIDDAVRAELQRLLA
ncbi:MAG: alpha/beta hydrolase [Pseudomonadota bacterium]